MKGDEHDNEQLSSFRKRKKLKKNRHNPYFTATLTQPL